VAFFITDIALFNDPTLTWSWTDVGRRPILAPSTANRGLFAEGTPSTDSYTNVISDAKFPLSSWELRPEMIMVDGVPHLEGANYSKKRLYVDAIYLAVPMAEAWDLAGKLWKFLWFPLADVGVPEGAGHTARASTSIYFYTLYMGYA